LIRVLIEVFPVAGLSVDLPVTAFLMFYAFIMFICLWKEANSAFICDSAGVKILTGCCPE
jgi:hypothetical protein